MPKEIPKIMCRTSHLKKKKKKNNSLAENADDMSINDQLATLSLDLPLEPSMGGVILEHIYLSK